MRHEIVMKFLGFSAVLCESVHKEGELIHALL